MARIGIVGGGAAGLTTAWLLAPHHDVTLFERDDRLGGHADAVEVDVDGERAVVEAGFEFFSDVMFPSFNRLLARLGVPVRKFPMTITVHRSDGGGTYFLPPVRNARVRWSQLAPRKLLMLLELRRLLSRAAPLVADADTRPLVRDLVERAGVSRAFADELLYPMLQSNWGSPRHEVERFVAYDVFKYYVPHQPSGIAPFLWNEIVGGTGAYVAALAADLGSARVRTSASVHLGRERDRWIVYDRGDRHELDHLVLATNARQAAALLEPIADATPVREVLGSVRYFETRIAVHGDRRLLPADERDWAVVNMRHDGRSSWCTVHKARGARAPVFRSWVTEASVLPTPLYALRKYEHVIPDAACFSAQRALAPLQGRDGLFLAGAYTNDVDCHESAIQSAIAVARRLAPGTERLRSLDPAAAGGRRRGSEEPARDQPFA